MTTEAAPIGPPEIPAPPPPPGAGPGLALILDGEHFGPANGKTVAVRMLTEWGACCLTSWGTGQINVRWDEVAPAVPPAPAPSKADQVAAKRREARAMGYMGDPCPSCGAMKLLPNGSCLKCDSCGETTGCS